MRVVGNNATLEASDGSQTYAFKLYEYSDSEVEGSDLNELYNAAGFNFEFVTKDYNGTIDNPFNDEALTAIEVAADVKLDGSTNFGFPKGIYFATETPSGAYPSNGDDTKKLNYLLNCTFIAVSPTDNISTNKDKQNKGEGFQLTTVAGKDLNLMFAGLKSSVLDQIDADEKPAGSTINVNNAAFTVKTNTVNQKNKYALSLAKIFYSKQGAKATDLQVEAAVYLNVASDKSYSGTQGLVTLPGAEQKFIFQFVESNVADGTDFISADGKSVYNITVFDADGEDFNLASLADGAVTATGARNYDFFAVGNALAEADKPSYQWVVTKVADKNVTFTNRATGEAFTAKLFEQGDGYYTLAVEENADQTVPGFAILDIKRNGDVAARVDDKGDYDKQPFHLTWVKLTPAEVEEVSGLNVANGTQVTLAFARDYTPTSNKMYPVVKHDKEGDYSFEDELTDEVAEAAQWQLVKSTKPLYQTFTYAYLDKDEKVAYKSKGDTVAYYTYKMQLVEDGNPAGQYMAWKSNAYGLANETNEILTFVIKENKDGSVAISKSNGYYLSVEDYNKEPAAKIEDELDRKLAYTAFSAESQATDIKAFFVADAPEVSLPATASYITLQSELGNYIAMNGEKDGIVINNEPQTYRVFATDLKAVVPSFLISTGYSTEDKARDFLFNPEDSVNYYVGAGQYDKVYQWSEKAKKAIFKSGILNESNDTLTTSIKGKVVEVAKNADNKGTRGGLNRFKFQIVLADGEEDLYVIRQLGASAEGTAQYLSSINDKLTWKGKDEAMKFVIADTVSPTANEAIAAEGVQVIDGQGVVTVQGAAGKVITVANILGQTIANQVAASDNVTIAAPAGVVVVAVEGEATKVVVK